MLNSKRFWDVHEENGSFQPFIENNDLIQNDLKSSLKWIKRNIPNIEEFIENILKRTYGYYLPSKDQEASIRLYLAHREGNNEFCIHLNKAIRLHKSSSSDESFAPYLKLLLTALTTLPSDNRIICRLSKENLTEVYQPKSRYVWWGISSCVEERMARGMLSQHLVQTVFVIKCQNARDVSQFTSETNFKEYILLPGFQFKVDSVKIDKHIVIIEITEIEQNKPIFKRASVDSSRALVENDDSAAYGECRQRSTSPDKKAFDINFHHQNKIMTPEELIPMLKKPKPGIDETTVERLRGSMVGMAIGDALGAHVEFRPHDYLVKYPVKNFEGGGTWNLKKGQFTDDTSMALCLGASLVICKDFNPYDQLVRYKSWYQHGYMSSTGKCFDIGVATRDSLVNFETEQIKYAKRHKLDMKDMDSIEKAGILKDFNVFCSKPGVAGNGALMRLAPVPLFFRNHPKYAVEFSGFSGVITHGDDKALDACRYYGALIVAALDGEDKNLLLAEDFYDKHNTWFNNKPLCNEVMSIARGSFKKSGGYADGIRGKGYIINALEAALWAFWSTSNFKDGACAAVNLGDDTDTTAAIFGQLAGAVYGYSQLHPEWVKSVYAREYLISLSDWIAYEGSRWNPNNSFYKDKINHLDKTANDKKSSSTRGDYIERESAYNFHASVTPKYSLLNTQLSIGSSESMSSRLGNTAGRYPQNMRTSTMHQNVDYHPETSYFRYPSNFDQMRTVPQNTDTTRTMNPSNYAHLYTDKDVEAQDYHRSVARSSYYDSLGRYLPSYRTSRPN